MAGVLPRVRRTGACAGVSPALDNVCDQILGDPPRHRMPQLNTANAVVNALTKVLGSADASLDLERRLKQPIPKVGARSSQPNLSTTAAPVSALLDQPTEPIHPIRPQVLPAAVPTIFTGIRLAGAFSILILIAAEMVGAKAGLGYLINYAQYNFAVPDMYAGIITISAIGLVVNQLLIITERRFSTWRTTTS